MYLDNKSFDRKKYEEVKRIIEILPDDERGKKRVPDGIISIDDFSSESIRLLWILKEVNDKEKEGGGWDLCGFIEGGFKDEEGKIYNRWQSTYGLVVKISAGILNNENFKKASEFDLEKATKVLKRIAVINVNKYPGGEKNYPKSLEIAFKKFEPILMQQIESIAPHIIICGGTFDLFDHRQPDESDENAWISIDGNRLWIGAYHPGQSKITHEVYFNAVLDKANKFLCRR